MIYEGPLFMLQFQSFWVFRSWISNGRGNFRKALRFQGVQGSRGPGGAFDPKVLGVLESQDWVPLFYHALNMVSNHNPYCKRIITFFQSQVILYIVKVIISLQTSLS